LKTIWYVLTLDCEQADRIRSMARSGNPTRAQRVGEFLHRMICGACRRARRQIEKLDGLLQDARLDQLEHAEPMSAETRSRLLQEMKKRLERNTQ